jgi:hypothetical protein
MEASNSDPEDGTVSKKQKKSKEMMASEQKKLPNWFYLGSASARNEWLLKKTKNQQFVERREQIDRKNIAIH